MESALFKEQRRHQGERGQAEKLAGTLRDLQCDIDLLHASIDAKCEALERRKQLLENLQIELEFLRTAIKDFVFNSEEQ